MIQYDKQNEDGPARNDEEERIGVRMDGGKERECSWGVENTTTTRT